MAIPSSPHARLFYRAAKQRYDDAVLLLQLQRTTGAVYLAGYSVECMLKALILESVPDRQEPLILAQFRGQQAHNPGWLLGLYRKTVSAGVPVGVITHLIRVNSWSTDMRYQPSVMDEGDAQGFMRSVEQITLWVEGRL